MSYSYNNIFDKSDNRDREINKEFNKNILNSSIKKKSNQEDIDIMVNKTFEKIFDVIKYKDKNYFLDKKLNTIWDENTNIVGLVDKSKYIWFEEQESTCINLIKELEETNKNFYENT